QEGRHRLRPPPLHVGERLPVPGAGGAHLSGQHRPRAEASRLPQRGRPGVAGAEDRRDLFLRETVGTPPLAKGQESRRIGHPRAPGLWHEPAEQRSGVSMKHVVLLTLALSLTAAPSPAQQPKKQAGSKELRRQCHAHFYYTAAVAEADAKTRMDLLTRAIDLD